MVAALAEIDTTTAGQLRAVLFEWQTQGYTAVVVDLTGTQFCDSTGLRELVWAHRRAVAGGGGLRLVTRAEGAVARIFTVIGLDGILPRYQTVQQALGQAPATAARRPSRGTAAGPAAAPDRAGGPRRPDLPPQLRAMRRGLRATARARAVLQSRLPRRLEPRAPRRPSPPGQRAQLVARRHERGHHPALYDSVLAARTPAGRQLIVETLAGLRFVRNWISRETGLQEAIDASKGWRITGWTWKPSQRTGTSLAPAPRASMGTHAPPRLPGPPGRSHHRHNLRQRRDLPRLHRRGRSIHHRDQRHTAAHRTPPAQAGDLGSTANL